MNNKSFDLCHSRTIVKVMIIFSLNINIYRLKFTDFNKLKHSRIYSTNTLGGDGIASPMQALVQVLVDKDYLDVLGKIAIVMTVLRQLFAFFALLLIACLSL